MTRPLAARIAGLLLLVLGLLPIANWIPGGHEAPWYAERLADWLSGGALVLGLGVIAGMTVRRYPAGWQGGWWSRMAARWQRGGARADAVIALLVLIGCAVVALGIFSGRPLLIDEIIQVYQARIFAQGRTWLPADPHPFFTSAMHLLDWNGKVYGQFPAGGPAFLALGTLLGAEWLVGPVAATLTVWFFARLLRRIEPSPSTALAALLLFATAPFVVFLGGSHMNHVTTTAALLGAALALAIATADASPRIGAAFWCGLALGIAGTIRPMDGAVFALPAGLWLLWRARGGARHVAALLASGAGVAIPLGLLLLVNASQTGDPLRFGYIEMWGKTHELGFHAAPWGPPHTPLRGIELINLYLLRLQTWLFEAPAPSLLFATAALLLARRLSAFDRWILAACGGLLLAYFAYWHDGFYLGPRFMLPLAPWLILWTARLPGVLAERGTSVPVRRGVLVAGMASLLLGLGVFAPIRGLQYRNGMTSMRFDIAALARDAGARDAIVLVRESWGGQLMTRLWGIGVSRPRAEQLYRTTDACRLEEELTAAERAGGAAALEAALQRHPADSAALRHLTASPDTTLMILPGSIWSPRCMRRIEEDRAGFTLYPPLLLVEDGNRYILDLHALDSLVIDAQPGRPVWLLTRPPEAGAGPVLTRVTRDSARAEWNREPQ